MTKQKHDTVVGFPILKTSVDEILRNICLPGSMVIELLALVLRRIPLTPLGDE
jgi:hypothetical protein